MTIYQLCGWIATTLFGLCYLPQIVKTYKRKEVDDVSFGSWIITWFGYTLGLVYGFYLEEPPLISGYIWGWLCTTCYLCLYWKYRNKHHV